MKLYHTPITCSRALHIALHEAGLPFEAVRVDLASKTLQGGGDYTAINPKGSVPALQLDDGSVLTENAVLLQYIADQVPATKLLPEKGMARYRVLEIVNFIATDLHKAFAPFFGHPLSDEARAAVVAGLRKRFDFAEQLLGGNTYIAGDNFTIADAYLFTILGWLGFAQLDLASWPRLAAYYERLSKRPAIAAALHAESA